MRSALIAAAALALLPVAALAQPISGPYVAAGAGGAFMMTEPVSGPRVGYNGRADQAFNPGFSGVGSVGYGFGNGVRLEVQGNWMRNTEKSTLLPGQTAQSQTETKTGAMLNALFDTDIGSRYVFPYLGLGAGYQSVNSKYAADFSNGATTRLDEAKGVFAYQPIIGVAFPIPGVVGLSVTAEYRFLGLIGTRKYTATHVQGGVAVPDPRRSSTDNTNNVLVGLRYAFDVPRPPTPAPAAAAEPAIPAPAPAAARSYLVFFDWDRAELSDRARQIVADAATGSAKAASTRISVAGHADSSGTPAYNAPLSQRRADAVAAELVRLGVPKAAISITAFGDTKPLVPTAAGVREPQNRRVEIVLQ